MNSKSKTYYIITDVESTGCNQLSDRIFDIAFILTDGKNIIETYQSLIKVDEKILLAAKKTIGHIINIDIDAICSAPSAREVYLQALTVLEGWCKKYPNYKLVAHNIHFDYSMTSHDMSVVDESFKNRYQSLFKNYLLDTITLSKKLYPDVRSRSLDYFVDYFKIDPKNKKRRSTEGHSALLDCELLFEILKKMLEDLPFESFMGV